MKSKFKIMSLEVDSACDAGRPFNICNIEPLLVDPFLRWPR